MATIRPLTLEDLNQVMALEKQLFPYSPWSKEAYIEDLTRNPYAYYYALVDDDLLLGYGGIFKLYENAEILTIGISPDFQRKGYGYQLLKYLLDQAKECCQLSLEVKADNEPAIHLYEAMGFKKATIRKNYYQDGSDAILMVEVKR